MLQRLLQARHHPNAALWVWITLGGLGWVVLPWYALPEGGLWQALPQLFGDAEHASGVVQTLVHGRPWLGLVALGYGLAKIAAWQTPGRSQSNWLIAAAVVGAGGTLACGFAMGGQGWAWGWLHALFGELGRQQFGMGYGAALALSGLLMLGAFGLARRGAFRGDLFIAGSVVGCAVLLLLFIAYPVGRALVSAFVTEAGTWSLLAWVPRIANERIWGLGCLAGGAQCGVAWNTLWLGLLAAAGTTVLGTLMALAAERFGDSRWRAVQGPLKVLGMLPMITPPFVVGLGLILLFGRAGLVNQVLEALFGLPPSRWFYGALGVWIAQLFAFTPVAFMIMRGVVQGVAPSLEEASVMLRANRTQTFLNVTLPLLKPGLANAFLVGFIESMADFGNPIVVGGQYSVLSTEIFFAIVGAQYDQGRAAALAWLLTLFALGVFLAQRAVLGRQSYTTVSGKGDAGLPLPLPDGLARVVKGVVAPWIAFTLLIYVFALVGGFVQTWGRDYSPTLHHFRTAFDLQWGDYGLVWAGTAWDSLFTTVKLSALSAPLTAFIGLLIAWLLARTVFRGQWLFEFATLLAFAIPGTVLGVSYILAFNVPPLEFTGTGTVIVLSFLFRNLPVGVRAGTAAFKQLDKSLDEASWMLRASSARTLWHIVLPLLKPALVTALVYSFVRAMTTVSAVIFLVTAENELATTYILGRVGNGDYGVALAYCTVLMVFMALTIVAIQHLVGERRLGRRSAAAPTIHALETA